jgi:hypothetical protein
MDLVRVPAVLVMDDETVMLHMEHRHADELEMNFLPEPDRAERRMMAPSLWRTYHNMMHRLHPNDYDHVHNEEA